MPPQALELEAPVGLQLNRLLSVDLEETQKNAAKFTGWIIGICGVLNVNGKKLVLDLVQMLLEIMHQTQVVPLILHPELYKIY